MRHRMLAGLLVLMTACTAPGGTNSRAQERIPNDPQAFDQIERGRYLAVAGDCSACHTDPGNRPYAGGRIIGTPFGNLIAPNLTPDRETGIGAWSDDEFVGSLLDGTGKGGEHLYPAMPYTYYTRMSREDALAIRAYLNTLQPVHNRIVSNQLPFPFRIRRVMAAWNWLYFKPGRFQPVAGKSEEWNRGAYLVEGPEHCGMCHTPKNSMGGDKTAQMLQGAPLQGWFSPKLTTDPKAGLGAWSVEDIAAYLKTGQNRWSAAAGPMAEVITNSTSQLTDADLRAIAVYLKDQPAVPAPAAPPVAAEDPAMKAGQAIYADNCSACHGGDGSGVAGLFPPLKNNPVVQQDDPSTLIRVVLIGVHNVPTDQHPTGPGMPAMNWKLSDGQVAAVLTYIRNSWGNAAHRIAAGDVTPRRRQLASGVE